VTFDGIAKACAKAGGFPEPELVHFNPKDFDFPKGSKAFPMRDQHFFASIYKVSPLTGLSTPYTTSASRQNSCVSMACRCLLCTEPAHLAERFV
jgi:hypothetical protein